MSLSKPRKLDGEELKQYAVRLLGSRALSVGELKRKLTVRAADPRDIDAVVALLKDYGALNDDRYAEGFAIARAGSGNFGRQRVLNDLLKRKVASSIAQQAVQTAYDGVDETQAIEEYLQRKYRHQDLGAILRDRSKLGGVYRRLRLAGFATSPVIRVLKRYAEEADQLEGMEDSTEAPPAEENE